jgi:hypothetical protein
MGQKIEVGVKGVIPLTSTFDTGSFFRLGFGNGATAATRRSKVGPTIEVRLPRGLGVELDALYTRVGFDAENEIALVDTRTRTTAASWEFPLLAKLHLRHLFVDGGPSFRKVSGVASISSTTFPGGSHPPASSHEDVHLRARSPYGVAVGLGSELRLWRLHLSPEVRYMRWRNDRPIYDLLNSNPNQVDVLLGVTF